MTIEIIAVTGMPEIRPGDDVAALLLEALAGQAVELRDGDVIVVTHKIVSKAEGRMVEIGTDDEDHRRLVEQESAAILRRRDQLTISRTRHGFVCANAGVDRSNVPAGQALLLPEDADRSAHGLRRRLEQATGTRLAVVVTDTFGRAWRVGQTDVAIGVSGLPAVVDLRGTPDAGGRLLEATLVALADEVAAAADLAMGKASGTPAAIVRGLEFAPAEGRAADLVRDPREDLFL